MNNQKIPSESQSSQAAPRAHPSNLNLLIGVFEREKERIMARCRQWLLFPRDAEDAYQETFLRAVRAWEKFRSDCKIETWLFMISLNVCRNFNRRFKRRKTGMSLEYEDGRTSVECRYGHERFEPQEEVVFRSQLMGKIEEAMHELSASSQEILRLKIRDGLTYDELGAQLGIAAGTVKSRIFRARSQLRQRVDLCG